MYKTNRFHRVLALLLAALIAVPLLGISALAEDEAFTALTTYTDYLKTGDMWYNKYGLANATKIDSYRYDSTFYISEDQNTIKIDVKVSDEETVTELHTRDSDPLYFDYLLAFPAFGDALPVSEEGLADGTIWFDKEGFINSIKTMMGEDNEYLYVYEDAVFYLSTDETILRRSYAFSEYYIMNSDELIVDNPSLMAPFLREAGYDPNAGFTLLPKSEEGLNEGDYWFEADSFAKAFTEEEYVSYYANANYYLSDDGQTLRMEVLGRATDFVKGQGGIIFSFLHQVGEGPETVFTLLPTSDEGLSVGDYWFDVVGFAAYEGNDDYLNYSYYLSEDAQTLRIYYGSYFSTDIPASASYSYYYFSFLHQVGVDPNAGFVLLPTSEEGLADGEYWFDVEGYASYLEKDCTGYSFYLSEDAATIRVIYDNGLREDSLIVEGGSAAAFLRQVGVDPTAGFLPVSLDINEIECGGYLFLLDQYCEDSIDEYNASLVESGKDPLTAEEEEEAREEMRSEIMSLDLFYNPETQGIGISESGAFYIYTPESSVYSIIIPYLQYVENHAWNDGAVTKEASYTEDGEMTYTCTRCGETKTEPIPMLVKTDRDVFWAGYEDQLDAITLDEGDKPAVNANDIFMIAKGSPIKVQLRNGANGSTVTFARNAIGGAAPVLITDVVYEGVACELWVLNRGKALEAGTHTAIAKYSQTAAINSIAAELGFTFEVAAPAYDTTVYSAKIETIDPTYGYIVFDGTTKQVITVETGVDVEKVQLLDDASGTTLTYNANNAAITTSELADGTPVLVWTIERLFARGEYAYSIYTRSVVGLTDSETDLTFKVDAPADDEVLVSAEVAVNEDGTDTFTVVTKDNVSKVKLTAKDGSTITATKAGTDKVKVAIADNENGTITWSITVKHHAGETYDCQALLGNAYTGAKQVSVPADAEDPMLVSVRNAVADGKITFTVVTREDVSKVRLTNKTAGATLTAVPGGTEKIGVSIAANGDGTSVWTITVKFADSYVSEYDCQAFIGKTASDVLTTTVEKPE